MQNIVFFIWQLSCMEIDEEWRWESAVLEWIATVIPFWQISVYISISSVYISKNSWIFSHKRTQTDTSCKHVSITDSRFSNAHTRYTTISIFQPPFQNTHPLKVSYVDQGCVHLIKNTVEIVILWNVTTNFYHKNNPWTKLQNWGFQWCNRGNSGSNLTCNMFWYQ